MHLARVIPCAVLLVTGAIFIIRANVIFFRILDDVNTSRAANQQVSFLFVNLRAAQVMVEHSERFPADRKPHQMKVFFAVGLALILLTFLVLVV